MRLARRASFAVCILLIQNVEFLHPSHERVRRCMGGFTIIGAKPNLGENRKVAVKM